MESRIQATRDSDLVVAGVGASAGGLEAFSQLLEALPPDPGLAIVLVQHLAPQHESALALLLGGRTKLPVIQATESMEIEPNHVYVIPPNVQMGVVDGRLHLMPRPTDRSQYTPIDFFLRSLADAYQERAIAIVLSGTASDGTVGVREVKAVGGITIAQRPDTAKYDGMPRAAIATDLVDLVLSPAEIAHELVRIVRHPLRRVRTQVSEERDDESPEGFEGYLDAIFSMLRSLSGVDFRRYKRPTIQRRLQRRMVLHKLTRIDHYVQLLRERPEEVRALYQDILIHVTRFFRDPESFNSIAVHVLPKIMETLGAEQPIRIWVPGCSTGEEAYSIAITVLDFLGDRAGTVPVQVFATDVSESAIEHARGGLYPQGIVADVPPEHLRRFFNKVDGGFRVTKAVRDMCIFARQDLTRDPPFSKLDLILCRNVLIYLGPDPQKRLLNVFHYALKPNGFLVLGGAETIGLHSDLFAVTEKRNRIYQKRLASVSEPRFPFEHMLLAPPRPRLDGPPRLDDTRSVQAEANRLIEERYAPPGVVVDAQFQVVQFRGQTGAFLQPAPGDPSHNVLKMAREGLLHTLRSALEEARRSRTAVSRRGVRVRTNGGWDEIAIEILPLALTDRMHFVVLFDTDRRRISASTPPRPPRLKRGRRAAAGESVARLQEELASSREYLQSIIQELEAANEELQSANEEVLSANEELQSTNEELDTAKEELQSTNEELNTVNEELHGRNEELSLVNSDLMNLLGSVQIAIVIVASDLRIRRFTPMAEQVLNLIPGDVGRSIAHIKPNIDCPDLESVITQVIDTVTPAERDVVDRQGNWYSLRVRPYKNLDNRIDGAVLALFDIQPDRDEYLRRIDEITTALADGLPQPVAIVDSTLSLRAANEPFRRAFALPAGDSRKRITELGDGGSKLAGMQPLLEDLFKGTRDSGQIEVTEDSRALTIDARRIGNSSARPLVLLRITVDTTSRPAW